MAADWIKMRADLHRDPAVISIARACKLDAYAVVGRLHAVWAWADSITADGSLEGVDAALIDQIAGRKGFAAAMAATPGSAWLRLTDAGAELPRFDRHNGKSAKRRALERDRKVAERVRKPSASRPHSVTRASGQTSASDAVTSVTREDERREERDEKQRQQLSGAAAPGPPPAKPKRAPSGPVQELLTWFQGQYERLLGSPYPITARDAVAVTRALKSFQPDDLRERLLAGLQTDHAWIANTDRSLALLLGQVNHPALRGMAPTPAGGRPTVKSQIATIAEVGRRLAAEEQQLEQH